MISRYLDHRKAGENKEKDLGLIDRWAMNALIPNEKELTLLMRYEGRLTRHLRLDLLHFEHMKRQRREDKPALSGRWDPGEDTKEPLLGLAEPEPNAPALRPAAEPESRPTRGFAEPEPTPLALRPAGEPESLGEPLALRKRN